MSPHHKHLHLLVYSFILNKGDYPCQVVIHINKYWFLPNLSGVENFPVALKTVAFSIGVPTWPSRSLYMRPSSLISLRWQS